MLRHAAESLFALAQRLLGLFSRRDIFKDDGELALFHAISGDLVVLIQFLGVVFKMSRLSGQGHLPINVDPIGFRVGQNLAHCLTDDVGSAQPG